MTTKEVIKAIMNSRGFTNQMLADKLGYKYASGVSERLRSDDGIRVNILLNMLDAMGCELVVRSKLSDRNVWVINGTDNSITPEERERLLNQ